MRRSASMKGVWPSTAKERSVQSLDDLRFIDPGRGDFTAQLPGLTAVVAVDGEIAPGALLVAARDDDPSGPHLDPYPGAVDDVRL